MCICVSLQIGSMSAGAHRGWRMESDPPELESQEAGSHRKWVLRTELRSPGRTSSVLTR